MDPKPFIENYLHFMKNCIRPPYEKLKSLKSGFIENSNFEKIETPVSVWISIGSRFFKVCSFREVAEHYYCCWCWKMLNVLKRAENLFCQRCWSAADLRESQYACREQFGLLDMNWINRNSFPECWKSLQKVRYYGKTTLKFLKKKKILICINSFSNPSTFDISWPMDLVKDIFGQVS